MKDNLEDFIRANREAFDDLEPRAETWSRISAELKGSSKKDYTWVWKVAAAVFLCLSIGLAFERTLVVDQGLAMENTTTADHPSQELQEVEQYYTQQIEQKRGEIQLVINEKGLTDNELLEDMAQLDEMYVLLKEDLKQNQNDERLINAMIQNLQLRVEILNKQLKILEHISKKENDAKISV